MRRNTTGGDATDSTNRRRFLKTLGAVGIAGLAGCGGDGDGTATETPTPEETEAPMETTAEETPTATEATGTTPGDTATETSTPGQDIPSDPPSIISFSGGGSVSPGGTTTLTGNIQNPYLFPIRNVEVSLTAPEGLSISTDGPTTFDELETQGTAEITWEISAPDDADGEYTVSGTVGFESATDSAETDLSHTVVVFSAGEVPESGLETYFSLDGDTAVNQVTGTEADVTGDPTTGVGGVLGNAWEFTTSGDPPGGRDSTTGAVTSGQTLPLNGETATVGAWVNFTDHEAYSRFYQVGGSVSEAAAGTGGYEVIFHGATDAPNDLLVADGAGRVPGLGADTGVFAGLSTGTWYFVVIVRDGADYRLHVFDTNGELEDSPATGSHDSPPPTSSGELLVLMSGDDSETAGRIDEVYAYSRALSEEEVLELYTGVGGSG